MHGLVLGIVARLCFGNFATEKLTRESFVIDQVIIMSLMLQGL